MGGGGAGGGPVLAAPHWLRDGDGWRQQSPGWRPGQTWSNLRPTDWRSSLGYRVMLVVAVHLEYHRLGLHVLYEGPGHRDGDVLNVVEVQRGALPAIFQRFSGECLVVPVNKTINNSFVKF